MTIVGHTPKRLDPERWGTLFGLLSMDVVTPFHEKMGLDVPDEGAFVALLRRLIRENREAFAKRPTEIPPLAENALAAIEAAFGKEARGRVEAWGKGTFAHKRDDHRDLWRWMDLLATARRNPASWKRLFGPTGKADEALAELARANDVGDVHAISDEVDERPLSDWDLEMYALHHFDEEGGNDPYNWVINTVNVIRARSFFTWLSRALPEADLGALTARAEELAQAHREHRFIKHLAPIRDLLRQP